jgi:hypothetical protein
MNIGSPADLSLRNAAGEKFRTAATISGAASAER